MDLKTSKLDENDFEFEGLNETAVIATMIHTVKLISIPTSKLYPCHGRVMYPLETWVHVDAAPHYS